FKISFSIFIIIVLGSAFFIYQQNNKTDLSYQIGKLDIHISEVDGFIIKENNIKDNIQNIFAEKEKEKIKLKIISALSQEKADEYVNQQTIILEGLFEPKLPPYPEFLTKEAACPEKFKPILNNSDFGKYYLLYAGARFGYGVCSEDLIKYKAVLGFFYCSNTQRIYKIEYFIPNNIRSNFNSIEKIINSFNCL
ncbi:MAG: hypothetical protein V3T98_01655, partial [Candidatus Paceibacterota bacterium]